MSALSKAGFTLGAQSSPCPLAKPLRLAAAEGRLSQVRLLLKAGALPNHENASSPLCLAIAAASAECALALMEAGASVSAGAGDEWHTPVSVAAMMGDSITLGRLIERGASVNELTIHGESAFTLILRQGDVWAMELLLSAGARADAVGEARLLEAFKAAAPGPCLDLAWASWEREQLQGVVISLPPGSLTRAL